MERRSAHKSTPRRRYTVDAFEGIAELEDARSSSEEPGLEDVDMEEDSAEDFSAAAQPPSPSSASSSASDGGEGVSEDGNDMASDAGDRLLADDISIADIDDEPRPFRESNIPATPSKVHSNKGVRRRTRMPQYATPSGPVTHTRGTSSVLNKASHSNEGRRRIFYGGEMEDAKPAYAAREKWGMDERVLPKRSAMGRSGYVDEAGMGRREKEEAGLWEGCGGLEACFAGQRWEETGESKGREYLRGEKAAFLMGPFMAPQRYELSVGGSMPLREAWKEDAARMQKRPTNYKNGFMLNAGGRVNCLAWAPHQHGQYQYLAVSVLSERPTTQPSDEESEAPAFSSQTRAKSSIQIWAFGRQESGTVDTAAGCHLTAVLCTDWGDIKELKFCPSPTANPPSSNDTVDLGLLVGIWSDGSIRVLRLNNVPLTSTTAYLHITNAAFSSRPPDTVCTCLSWLSSTRIAAGCANGFVAIWSLPHATQPTASSNARPEIYTSIATTYILSVTSCYPSRPNFILTYSMSGQLHLTDLSRPPGSPASNAPGLRTRIVYSRLAWHDHLQIAVHVEDNNFVRGSPIRRVFTSTALARVKGTATALAVSACHPYMLVGSASGAVSAVNAVTGVWESNSFGLQLVWFAHEWRPARGDEVDSVGGNGEVMDGVEGGAAASRGRVGSNGLSRIAEGFKIDRDVISKEGRVEQETNAGPLPMTVFEEKSAVSALAWNPNIEAGGWAAAGMGDGLLRIEDLAT
ncbi:uncharacterized protein LTR77_005856 [Saxophila tyrrhenica]|uniref:Transcription factor TFIIIC complex subunit Tfc6 n=1 Tax=Saxophila tyrrhenica TaxID=1690608 RepID=A0AAV9PAH0_9PEZI|nr:hypothetical protein LTR77_005856 [Saxophila tyrrhenica]